MVKLHGDLLWLIFMMNVDVEGHPLKLWFSRRTQKLVDTHPLTTTRRTSQVCREWRDIVLSSTSIWGKLLYVDMLDQKSDNWRTEVLRRSGGSILDVKGRLETEDQAEFFFLVLNDHWERISTLDVTLVLYPVRMPIRSWGFLQQPASNLRSLFIDFPMDISLAMLHDSRLVEERLFADQAPVLREFSSKNIAFNLRAPWVCHLRKLETTRFFTVREFLEAAKNIPQLASINIDFSNDHPPWILSTDLPHLSLERLDEIRLTGCLIGEAAVLLDHILPAKTGCILSLRTRKDRSAVNDEAYTSACRTLVRFGDHYFQLRKQVESIVLSIGEEFHLKEITPHSPYFFIQIHNVIQIPQRTSIVLDQFSSTFARLNNTLTTLNLSVTVAPHSIHYIPTLLSLTSVTSLITVFDETLDFLAEVNFTIALFPNLRNMTVNSIPSNKGRSLHTFLRCRREAGYPLETLNVKDFRVFDFRMLEDIVGLKVLFIRDKEEMEYTCGNGSADLLYSKHALVDDNLESD